MIVIFEREEDNDMAVLQNEDGSTCDVRRDSLPVNAKPGDSLEILPEGTYRVLEEETKHRKERVQKLLDELWEK
ncbi:MAG: DUF3006 domain-containing protein [Peptococcaceae bacterium]|nr:DUF3006 domain-containing protein [Peptococcaceae bacterium]